MKDQRLMKSVIEAYAPEGVKAMLRSIEMVDSQMRDLLVERREYVSIIRDTVLCDVGKTVPVLDNQKTEAWVAGPELPKAEVTHISMPVIPKKK